VWQEQKHFIAARGFGEGGEGSGVCGLLHRERDGEITKFREGFNTRAFESWHKY
jgi:hypothetical protein